MSGYPPPFPPPPGSGWSRCLSQRQNYHFQAPVDLPPPPYPERPLEPPRRSFSSRSHYPTYGQDLSSLGGDVDGTPFRPRPISPPRAPRREPNYPLYPQDLGTLSGDAYTPSRNSSRREPSSRSNSYGAYPQDIGTLAGDIYPDSRRAPQPTDFFGASQQGSTLRRSNHVHHRDHPDRFASWNYYDNENPSIQTAERRPQIVEAAPSRHRSMRGIIRSFAEDLQSRSQSSRRHRR